METLTENTPVVVSRRSFLLGMSATGFALACTAIPGASTLLAFPEVTASFEPNMWVKIDPDGTVTITVAKPDIGQGVRTSLAMIVADEADVDWNKVKVRQASPGTGYSNMGVGGSGSVTGSHNTLRKAGATVRAMMISAAAKQWGIAESNCTTSNGVVSEKNGTRTLTYGELTDAAAAITVPSNPTQKVKANFTIIGKRISPVDTPDIVRGTAKYGLDVRVPGMKYAILALPPTIGGSVQTVDASEALKVKGVIKAERVSGIPGVVILADNSYAAIKGKEALKITWNLGNNTAIDSAVLLERMKTAVGTVADVPANSAIKIQAEYHLPYIAHATMEPMNCVADVKASSAEVWAPTQSPEGVLSAVASATGIASANIKVNVTLAGGGFGRRSNTEYASYAARISKQYGVPVLFMYTRTDDMRNDGYRPASYHVMKGGLDAAGNITGWNHKFTPGSMGSNPSPYVITSPSTTSANYSSPVPTGAWRSVGHSTAIFANECFIDELAVAAGKDPYQFRRNLLPVGRMRDVLDEAANRIDWTRQLPKGWGRGIACTNAYSSVAHAIEVSVSDAGVLKIERVVCVVDCGLVINVNGVEAQMQGAAIDAFSTALKAGITIDKGGIKQTGFADFEWLRMNDLPKIEVYIMPSTSSSPSGMGEAGFPSASPALCNAIFNATGKRIRTLPIQKTFLTEVETPALKDEGTITVHPNPISEMFTISGRFDRATAPEMEIRITNLLGNTIHQATAGINANGDFSTPVYMPPSADGVYMLTVRCANATITTKIIKQ